VVNVLLNIRKRIKPTIAIRKRGKRLRILYVSNLLQYCWTYRLIINLDYENKVITHVRHLLRCTTYLASFAREDTEVKSSCHLSANLALLMPHLKAVKMN